MTLLQDAYYWYSIFHDLFSEMDCFAHVYVITCSVRKYSSSNFDIFNRHTHADKPLQALVLKRRISNFDAVGQMTNAVFVFE